MVLSKTAIHDFFQKREQLGIKPGLKRMEQLLQMLGHPEQQVSSIHVAGTNGKGSVIQFLQAALLENGYITGVFTSPSFAGLEGHFLVNGTAIGEEDFITLFNQLFPSIQQLDEKGEAPTVFEILTVMAFLYFKQRVDIAIIETGMGGRYDTTNAITPCLSVITTIAMDHMQFLGDALPTIAWQKAGIIKPKTPVVIGHIGDEASKRVFKEESNQQQAPLYRLFDSFSYKLLSAHLSFLWLSCKKQIKLRIRMEGKHQIENATVAFQALQVLKQQGFHLNDKHIQKGFLHATLPGRFEIIQQQPPIILDSAHNVEAIHVFLETFQSAYPDKHKKVLFAGFRDKQLDKMLNLLEQAVDEITITTFNHPRAAVKKDYQHWLNQNKASFVSDWKEAAHLIREGENGKETVYAITGSLHFITYVRRCFT